MKKRTLTYFYILTAVLLVLCGCERRELEVEYSKRARVRIDVDWMSRFGERPSGMTVMIYPDNGGAPVTELTNEVDSIEVTLEEGGYSLLIFNLTTDEYSDMHFEGLQRFDEATVRARVGETLLVGTRGTEDVRYQEEPERIGVAVDHFEITKEMVVAQNSFMPYDEWKKRAYDIGSLPREGTVYVLKEVVMPELTRLHVKVRLHGANNAYALTGSLSGMADGFSMAETWRTTETTKVLLPKWNLSIDEDNKTKGWLTCEVPVFGLPHGKELQSWRTEADNQLNLYFTLKDGSTKAFYYLVGKMVHYEDMEEATTFEKEDVLRHIYLTIDEDLAGPDKPDPLKPGDPKDPDGPDNPDDPDKPGKPDDPDKPVAPDPTDPDHPVVPVDPPDLPDVPHSDDPSTNGASGFDAEVAPWEDGGTVDVGM